MLRVPQIEKVVPLSGYRVHLAFDDGNEGEVDLKNLIKFQGVFEVLKDEVEFCRVFVDADGGTIAWPNGADIDPIVLYSALTGKSIEELLGVNVTR